MKQKTKKSLKKFSLFLIKLIFYYPFKGLWWLLKKLASGIKWLFRKTKEKHQQKKADKVKPKIEAKYQPLTEIKTKSGKMGAFENKLFANTSTIGLILGARGTGKSALGMRLLENFKNKTEKKVYALGFKEESLPAWIKSVKAVQEIENNGVILIDEGGIEFSSRNSMANPNKLLSQLLLIARHKDLSVIFITQNSANLEINVIRQADYLLLKPSSLLQKDFERGKIKDIYESVDPEFQELKETIGLTYIYSDNFSGFVTNTLPTFWSEGVSKSYRGK